MSRAFSRLAGGLSLLALTGKGERQTLRPAPPEGGTGQKKRERFFRRPMNWAMEKSILAAYTPPLQNKVQGTCGFPDTPSGWAYPVLDCAGVRCGCRVRCRLGGLCPSPAPVGGGCGRPHTPLGRAYPVLAGAVDWSGRIPSANWESFTLPCP